MFPSIRPRRLRSVPALRELIRETQLTTQDLIYPLFIHHDPHANHPIPSMPGQAQLGIEQLAPIIETIVSLGIPGVILFGIPAHKDATGSSALSADGVIQQAIKKLNHSRLTYW
jgi:porphobilinogen synthase